MKRNKRIMAIIMTIAMVLTSANLPQISIKAKAAVTPPAENMKDTSILTVKGDDLSSNLGNHVSGEAYNGYLQSMTKDSANADYYKITFKVAEGTAEDTKIVTFQPYDTSYQGWQDNISNYPMHSMMKRMHSMLLISVVTRFVILIRQAANLMVLMSAFVRQSRQLH